MLYNIGYKYLGFQRRTMTDHGSVKIIDAESTCLIIHNGTNTTIFISDTYYETIALHVYQTRLKKGEQMKMDDDKNMTIKYGDNLWRYSTLGGVEKKHPFRTLIILGVFSEQRFCSAALRSELLNNERHRLTILMIMRTRRGRRTNRKISTFLPEVFIIPQMIVQTISGDERPVIWNGFFTIIFAKLPFISIVWSL